jgi:hypothetical protein
MKRLAAFALFACSCPSGFDLPPGAQLSCQQNSDCSAELRCVAGFDPCLPPGTPCVVEQAGRSVRADDGVACQGGDAGAQICVRGACQPPACGDGILTAPAEQCDDGAANGGAGERTHGWGQASPWATRGASRRSPSCTGSPRTRPSGAAARPVPAARSTKNQGSTCLLATRLPPRAMHPGPALPAKVAAGHSAATRTEAQADRGRGALRGGGGAATPSCALSLWSRGCSNGWRRLACAYR